MRKEIEKIIETKNDVRVSVSEWEEGGVWLHLLMRYGAAYTKLTRDEAEQLMAGLQAILAKGES